MVKAETQISKDIEKATSKNFGQSSLSAASFRYYKYCRAIENESM